MRVSITQIVMMIIGDHRKAMEAFGDEAHFVQKMMHVSALVIGEVKV